jgi:hypothetical protein
MKQRIAELEDEKQRLEAEIGEQRRQIAFLEEEKAEKDIKIAELTKELEDCRTAGGTQVQPTVGRKLEAVRPGDKGKIQRVNSDWNFVIIELSDHFLSELAAGEEPVNVSGVELMLKRADGEQQFVTKVRLISARLDEGLAVADVMREWQQLPVEVGDVVFSN